MRLRFAFLTVTLMSLLTLFVCTKDNNGDQLALERVPLVQSSCLAASCHNTAPLTEYPPTSGMHTSHLKKTSIGSSNDSCNICHWDYEFNLLHRDNHLEGYDAQNGLQRPGNIVLFGGISGGNMVAGQYDNATDNCTNITCHGFGTLEVNWYTAAGACVLCHRPGNTFPGAPPYPTSGAHTRHVADNGNDCEVCHSGYMDSPTHQDGNLNTGSQLVNLSPDLNPSGSYDGANCNNLYCHGYAPDWTARGYDGGAARNNNPAWNGSVVCNDCHYAEKTGGNAIVTDRHAKHIDGTANYNFDCSRCHSASIVNSGPTLLSAHVNGNLDVVPDSGNSAGSYNTSANTCSSFYCHGNFTGGNTGNEAKWEQTGAGSGGDCGECHGLAPTNTAYGRHDRHTNSSVDATPGYGYDCSNCHSGIATGNESTAAFDPGYIANGHANFSLDVAFGGIADQYTGSTAAYSGNGFSPGSGGICTNVYCHGAFGSGATQWPEGNTANAPAWTGTAACGSCHGENARGIPNSGSTAWGTESHYTHAGAGLGTTTKGYDYPCGFCHNGVYDATISTGDGLGGAYESGTKIPDFTQHADGNRTALSFYDAFVHAGTGTASYAPGGTPQTGTCSGVYCHSDGWDYALDTFAIDTGGDLTPTWGGGSKTVIDSCDDCHNNGVGNPAPRHNGAAQKDHYDKTAHNTFGSCGHCHDTTAQSSGEGDTAQDILYGDHRHVNLWKNVKFGYDTASTGGNLWYSRTSGTCWVNCHGKNHNPKSQWYGETFAGQLKDENTGGDPP